MTNNYIYILNVILMKVVILFFFIQTKPKTKKFKHKKTLFIVKIKQKKGNKIIIN